MDFGLIAKETLILKRVDLMTPAAIDFPPTSLATGLPSVLFKDGAAALEPVVFLPGLLCDQALWRPQIDALSDRVAPMVADMTPDDSIQDMAARVLAAFPLMMASRAISAPALMSCAVPATTSAAALLRTTMSR